MAQPASNRKDAISFFRLAAAQAVRRFFPVLIGATNGALENLAGTRKCDEAEGWSVKSAQNHRFSKQHLRT
jgi:hypothetical protein